MSVSSSSTEKAAPPTSENWAVWGCGQRITYMRGRQGLAGEVSAAIDVRVAIPAAPGAPQNEQVVRFFPSFDIFERAYISASDRPVARIQSDRADLNVLGVPAVPSLGALVGELVTTITARAGAPGLLLVPQVWATSDASARILKPWTDAGWRLAAIEAACPPLPKGSRIVGGDAFFAWVNESNRAVAVTATPQAAVALALIDDVLVHLADQAPVALWKQWLSEEWPKIGWFTRQQIAERVRRALIGHTLNVAIGGLEDSVLAVSSADMVRHYAPLGQLRLHIEVPNPPAVREWLQASATAARLGTWTAQPLAIVGSPDLGRLRRAVEEQSGDIRTIELGMLAPLALGAGRDLRGFVRVVPDDVLTEAAQPRATPPASPAPAAPPTVSTTRPRPPEPKPPRDLPDLRPSPPEQPDPKPRNIIQRILGRGGDDPKAGPDEPTAPGPARPSVPPLKPAAPHPTPRVPTAPLPELPASAPAPLAVDSVDSGTPSPLPPPANVFELPWARRVIEIPTDYEWSRPVEVEVRLDGIAMAGCSVRQSRIAGVQYLIEGAGQIPARALVKVKFEPLFHE